MPQGGVQWGLRPTNYKYEVLPEYTMAVKAQQQAALQAARASSRNNSLSQLMSLVKVMNAVNKLTGGSGTGSGRTGGTAKERERAEAADRMAQAQRAVFDDANFQERYAKAQTLSAQRAVDEVAGIRNDIIKRYATEYEVEPDKLSKIMMGGLQSRTAETLKEVQKSRGDYGWESFAQGMSRFGRAMKRLWNSDEEAEADMNKTIEERVALERNNAYARDQALRAQEGEGAWSRADGLGGMVANSAAAIGNMAPQVASALAGRSAGSLIGGGVGFLLGGPGGAAGGAQLGGLVGTAVGGGTTGAAQGRFDYIERVLSDPNLTAEQKEQALAGWGAAGSAAVGGALGSVPFGLRDAARLVAPRVGFTQAGKEVAARTGAIMAEQGAENITQQLARRQAIGEITRKGLMQEASTPLLSRVMQSTAYAVPEVGTMLGAGLVANNAIYGSATGQDTPLLEGWQEALVSGLPMVGMVGAMGASRRMTPRQIPRSWNEDGTIKTPIAAYRAALDKQIADGNFGGEATKNLVDRFQKDWKVDESFAELTKNLEPKQIEALNTLKQSSMAPRQQGGDLTSRLAGATNNDRFDPEAAAAAAVKKATAEAKKPTATKTSYDDIMQWFRSQSPEWSALEQTDPDVAKQIVRIANRQRELHPDVQNIAEHIRANDGTVSDKSVLDWLNRFADVDELNRARGDLIKFLQDGLNRAKDLSGRTYSTSPLGDTTYWKGLLNTLRGQELKATRITPENVKAARSKKAAKADATQPQQPTVDIAAPLQNPVDRVPTGTLADNAQQMMQQNAPAAVADDAAPALNVTDENAAMLADVNYGTVPATREEFDTAIKQRYAEMQPELKQQLLEDEADFRANRIDEEQILADLEAQFGKGSDEVNERTELYSIDAEAEFDGAVSRAVELAMDNNWYANEEQAANIITSVLNAMDDPNLLPEANAEIARIMEARRTGQADAPASDTVNADTAQLEEARGGLLSVLSAARNKARDEKQAADNAAFDAEFQAGLQARAEEATRQRRQYEYEQETQRLANERSLHNQAEAERMARLKERLAKKRLEKEALKQQEATSDADGMVRNDPPATKTDDTGNTDADKPVETNPPNSDQQPTPENTDALNGNNSATKSRGSGGSTTPHKRQSKALVSNPKQEGAEQQSKGADPGRGSELPANEYGPRNESKRSQTGEDGGNKDGSQPQKSNSGEQQSGGEGVEQRPPLPAMPEPKAGKSISFKNAYTKMLKLSHQQLLDYLKDVPKYMQWRRVNEKDKNSPKQWVYGLERAVREGQRKSMTPEEQLAADNTRAELLRKEFIEALYAVKENASPTESQKYTIANFESRFGTIEYPSESMLGAIRTYRYRLDDAKRAKQKKFKTLEEAAAQRKKEAEEELKKAQRVTELRRLMDEEQRKGAAADEKLLDQYHAEYTKLYDERISKRALSDEDVFALMLADKKFMKDLESGKVVPEHIPTREELREAERVAAQASADRAAAMSNPHIVLDGEVVRVDTPSSAYNAIVRLAERDRSAFEAASGSPLTKNSKKLVKNIAYDSLAALYNASVDPAAMTNVQKEMWYAMYNQGFRPLRLDRRVVDSIKMNADRYRADHPKLTDADYFADTYMTERAFDSVLNYVPC